MPESPARRMNADLRPAPEDLERRRVAWEALSTLFLDEDIADSRHWRAAQLAPLPYTMDELTSILADEVKPACGGNLWSVAGVWGGFDTGWLEREIRRRLQSRWRGVWRLLFGRLGGAVALEWAATRAAIEALRAAGDGPGRP